MAKLFIEETTLTAIGDAIRGKEGTTELVPVNDMATRITNLPSGGGGGNEPTDEELTFTGNCQYKFSGWGWFVNKYGNRITTKDINSCYTMFSNCDDITSIPFQINVKNATTLGYMINYCSKLKVTPKVRGTINWTTSTTLQNMLDNCYNVRDFEDLLTPEMLEGFSTVKVTSSYSAAKPCNFSYARSLRRVPSWWYKFRLNPESTKFPAYSYTVYNYAFNYCAALDEVLNIPVWKCEGAITDNMFGSFAYGTERIKNLTFETNPDGSPIETQWKGQTIVLSDYAGHATSTTYILSNNSGITADKQVKDDATYQALKDDPDWFTINYRYSRYNHDSAVATINSLPDTSAYLATAGGTNTIKFKGAAGELTDGGAINTLTAEEIAVAAAKGWTVTFA